MAQKQSKAEREAAECDEAIAAMSDRDRAIAEKLHDVIVRAAPSLAPRTWYKQPAYALDGKNICFFRGADVDGERYLSFGFTGDAAVDDGNVWPTSYAITTLTAADEKRIAALVKKAVG
ncbi:MAG TPA: DUF1801 domain-containing protein [Acidimicrobiales bacterium]|nr:DUF1801 domain-containing protein [Acidimicrobiales bacterium]